MLSKQLFFLTNDQLCAYQWRRGVLSDGQRFGADRDGLDAFGQYLEDHPANPVHLVCDLIEEDFQRITLPHVGGRAGRQLLARRLGQMFRDTPWRHGALQGREPEGRRDDRVLCSALTNPQVLAPWLAQIELHKVPLAGVLSASLLGTAVVRRLALAQPHLLLVTQQSGGLRQSYFQGRHLKFSRLTASLPGKDDAAAIVGEIAKTQQFLASTRMLGRGELMQVAVIGDAPQLDALHAQCEDGADIAYQLIELAQAAERLKLRTAQADAGSAQADRLLLGLLGRQAPASHYALAEQARFYTLWKIRLGLTFATGAALLVSLVGLTLNLWSGYAALHASDQLRQEAQQLDARYLAMLRELPPTVTRTANMRGAVQLERMVAAQGPTPAPLMAQLSGALEASPDVSLNLLRWEVDGATPGGAPAAIDNAAPVPLSSTLLGIPLPPAQSLRIEAEVALPQGDYRAALRSMSGFVRALSRDARAQVEVLEPPLDVRPSVKLSGKAGAASADGKAKFVLKMGWKP